MRRRSSLFALFALFALPVVANWSTPVQKITAFSTGAVSSQAVTFGATPTVGNTIVLGVLSCCGSGFGAVTVTDNQAGNGNVYSRTTTLMSTGGPNNLGESSGFCATVGVASGTFTITAAPATSATAFITLFAVEYSGGSCDPDQAASAHTTSGSTYPCGSYTTTNANDLLVNILNVNEATDFTLSPSTGFTIQLSELSATGQGGGYSDQIVSSTASFSPSFTASISVVGNCVGYALKAASGGGGGGQVAYAVVQ